MRQAHSPFSPSRRADKQSTHWRHLAGLLAALTLTPACGGGSGGSADEAGAGGAMAGASGSSSGGSSSGGSSSGGSSSGGSGNGGSDSGGAAGSGGVGGGGAGGAGGSGAQSLGAVLTLAPGGNVAKSANFTLIGTVGETPGGNLSMTSANNRLDLGFVGATQ